MDILGIDISKRRFDVALLLGERTRQAVFLNTEAGFKELLAWLAKHRSSPDAPLHACMEATGGWTWPKCCTGLACGSASSIHRG